MTITNEQIRQMTELRHRLHACPELSMQEFRTKQMLWEFLAEHTDLVLHSCGGGFYAAHYEEDAVRPPIAVRADFDALALPEGGAAHLCGHDGHSAALCGAALAVQGKALGRNVFFLFQPGEETGAGAEGCLELLEKETVAEIYGQHNIPGKPFGQILTRPGTFTCGSVGLTLTFTGAATHAAYPELGISPAPAVGSLLCSLPEILSPEQYSGITLATVIGVQMGEKAFGAAAAKAEVWLTLRAETNRDLEALRRRVLSRARALAEAEHLSLDTAEQDVFAASENTPGCAEKVRKLCGGTDLAVPMRWSEDFSLYLQRCPGAFFGVGAGEDCPPLHAENYEYPDALLLPTAQAFLTLIEQA